MSYKTILVHVDKSKHAPARIKIAAEIALAENAHLIGAAMTGVSRYLYQDSAIDMNQALIAAQIEALNESAHQALAEFDSIAKQLGVASCERRLVNDEAAGGLAMHARYCDLVVVSQADLDEPSTGLASDVPEYVMLNSARPVLIVPYAGQFSHIGKNVLLGWDGSMEATRAITNALPLLKRAENVTVALFNASSQLDVHGEQPGADIALYLARHGIKVNVIEKNTKVDIGNAMLSTASDMQADLIVIGGYGHTRFREVVLGGVTTTLLKTMTVPTLMAH